MAQKSFSQLQYECRSAAGKIEELHYAMEANKDLVDDLPDTIEALMDFHAVLLHYNVDEAADILECIADPSSPRDNPRKWRTFIKRYNLEWDRGETPAEARRNGNA